MNSVVSAINAALAALSATTYGISTPTIVEDSEGNRSTIPAIINYDGECTYPDPEDLNKLTIYHRLHGNQYQQAQVKGYGDGVGLSIVYDMSMIVFGTRIKVMSTPDAVEKSIAALIPNVVGKCKIGLVSTDFDQNRVFASEFPNTKSFLDPSLFVFAIKYKVTCNYNSTNCLNN